MAPATAVPSGQTEQTSWTLKDKYREFVLRQNLPVKVLFLFLGKRHLESLSHRGQNFSSWKEEIKEIQVLMSSKESPHYSGRWWLISNMGRRKSGGGWLLPTEVWPGFPAETWRKCGWKLHSLSINSKAIWPKKYWLSLFITMEQMWCVLKDNHFHLQQTSHYHTS